ncbi:glycosyltransferase family 4 protein [Alteribacillus sp. HJP-4]|uniref:glycosyltransferase family 4 protein n=1 Tax=Alteribacillus sp. HJP-4 TaxID=2775394 RepID=UPI0035CD36F5
MKILYIHQYFKTRESSAGIRSYEFAKKLVEKGHTVTMLTGDSKLIINEKPFKKSIFINEYYIERIHVIAIKNKYSNYMSYSRRIISFLNFLFLSSLKSIFLKDYDVIYATSTPLTVGVPALLIKKIKKTPYVFEVRDLWPEAPKQMGAIKSPVILKLLTKLEKTIYKNSSHIVALSPGMELGVRNSGIDKNDISMVPNCCDLDLFKTVKNKEFFINKFELQNNLVVIHPGSMGSANGLEYLIKAAYYLKQKNNNNVKFLLTGDGGTKPILKKMCKNYRLNNVIFTGNIPKKSMPDLLAACDLSITSFKNIPILATNSPNKFFDSLAAGLPTIVNSNGWTKEIVEKNDIGFYTDPKDPKRLAELLDDLSKMESKILLKDMGNRARKLAESKYDRNKLALQVEKILCDVGAGNV